GGRTRSRPAGRQKWPGCRRVDQASGGKTPAGLTATGGDYAFVTPAPRPLAPTSGISGAPLPKGGSFLNHDSYRPVVVRTVAQVTTPSDRRSTLASMVGLTRFARGISLRVGLPASSEFA